MPNALTVSKPLKTHRENPMKLQQSKEQTANSNKQQTATNSKQQHTPKITLGLTKSDVDVES